GLVPDAERCWHPVPLAGQLDTLESAPKLPSTCVDTRHAVNLPEVAPGELFGRQVVHVLACSDLEQRVEIGTADAHDAARVMTREPAFAYPPANRARGDVRDLGRHTGRQVLVQCLDLSEGGVGLLAHDLGDQCTKPVLEVGDHRGTRVPTTPCSSHIWAQSRLARRLTTRTSDPHRSPRAARRATAIGRR